MSTNRRRRTIEVEGDKIRIVSRMRTNLRNFCGYRVVISAANVTEGYNINALERREAEDEAFARFVKSHR